MGALGPIHWLIIAAIVFLLFGNRLPSVMRSLGQGVVEFKKGLQGIEDDVKSSAAAIRAELKSSRASRTRRTEVEHGSRDAAPR